jgi:uncharacterized metal-binding protein YceD (DUF177 family)
MKSGHAHHGDSRLRLASLSRHEQHDFAFEPGSDLVSELLEEFGLLKLRKARLTGRLTPEGRRDWHLEATFGATVVQPCSVTLAPVTTRIDTAVERRFVADFAQPEEAEAEMPEDDTTEPLPDVLDLAALFAETLSIELPDFPRAEGASFGEAVFAPPGAEPLTADKVRPFGALEALKKPREE